MTEIIKIMEIIGTMLMIFIIRMLATKYRWSLPKIQTNEDINQ